jgi:hypothetical protein
VQDLAARPAAEDAQCLADSETVKEERYATDLSLCCKLDALVNIALVELKCYEDMQGKEDGDGGGHGGGGDGGEGGRGGGKGASMLARANSLDGDSGGSVAGGGGVGSEVGKNDAGFTFSPSYGLSTLNMYGALLLKYHKRVSRGIPPMIPPLLSFQMDYDQ